MALLSDMEAIKSATTLFLFDAGILSLNSGANMLGSELNAIKRPLTHFFAKNIFFSIDYSGPFVHHSDACSKQLLFLPMFGFKEVVTRKLYL
jgi:hypothetical protein